MLFKDVQSLPATVACLSPQNCRNCNAVHIFWMRLARPPPTTVNLLRRVRVPATVRCVFWRAKRAREWRPCNGSWVVRVSTAIGAFSLPGIYFVACNCENYVYAYE